MSFPQAPEITAPTLVEHSTLDALKEGLDLLSDPPAALAHVAGSRLEHL
jgi:hypothetical protein